MTRTRATILLLCVGALACALTAPLHGSAKGAGTQVQAEPPPYFLVSGDILFVFVADPEVEDIEDAEDKYWPAKVGEVVDLEVNTADSDVELSVLVDYGPEEELLDLSLVCVDGCEGNWISSSDGSIVVQDSHPRILIGKKDDDRP